MSDHILERNSDARKVPRRIALIRREAPARLLEDRAEQVPTAPHLLIREIILFQIVVAVLAVLSLVFDAPLEGIADPNLTPNPAKSPWYFLGLQELLHYFPPIVAGVVLPGLVVLGIIVIPYMRINLEVVGLHERPRGNKLLWITVAVAGVCAVLTAYAVWAVLVPTLFLYFLMMLPALPACPHGVRRRLGRVPLADWVMTWFVLVVSTLTLIGMLFRGPGWSWTWPWRDGIY